jgi:hypothetical protein
MILFIALIIMDLHGVMAVDFHLVLVILWAWAMVLPTGEIPLDGASHGVMVEVAIMVDTTMETTLS